MKYKIKDEILEVAGASDIGKQRELQEDSIYIDKEEKLFIVADGMGGHNAGEVASNLAVSLIPEKYKKLKEKSLKYALNESLKYANSKIYQQARKNKEQQGMGTTVVLITFYDGQYFICNVGDSRCYLLRKKKLTQITEDHSYVYEQYKKGLISKEEMKKSPYKNVITRAVGVEEEVKADFFIGDVKEGDIFLLCSDGLHSMLNDKEIKKILQKRTSLKHKVEKLIKEANKKGGEDNISVILIKIKKLKEKEIEEEKARTIRRKK